MTNAQTPHLPELTGVNTLTLEEIPSALLAKLSSDAFAVKEYDVGYYRISRKDTLNRTYTTTAKVIAGSRVLFGA